jgi:hypothetical protein
MITEANSRTPKVYLKDIEKVKYYKAFFGISEILRLYKLKLSHFYNHNQ